MLQIVLLLAEGNTGASGEFFYSLLLPIGFLFLFYFLLILPMRRQDRERQALLSSVKKNDRVLTAAGIYGVVVSVSEQEDEITVKVDENVRLKMTKGSIARNLTNEETARAAKAPGK